MDGKQKESLTKGLEHLIKRPRMYFSDSAPAAANYLEGFKHAFLLLNDVPNFYDIFKEVIVSRGWEDSPQAVWGQMQGRGWDEDAIIQELLAIHSQVFERITSSAELEPAERKMNGKA
jgi:hypothetical protein